MTTCKLLCCSLVFNSFVIQFLFLVLVVFPLLSLFHKIKAIFSKVLAKCNGNFQVFPLKWVHYCDVQYITYRQVYHIQYLCIKYVGKITSKPFGNIWEHYLGSLQFDSNGNATIFSFVVCFFVFFLSERVLSKSTFFFSPYKRRISHSVGKVTNFWGTFKNNDSFTVLQTALIRKL